MLTPLTTLHAAGLWVESDGTRLKVGPSSLLTDATRIFIQMHRAQLIEEVEAIRLAQTIANILALSPTDVAGYRHELDDALPDDPWLPHDRQALAQAGARRNRLPSPVVPPRAAHKTVRI